MEDGISFESLLSKVLEKYRVELSRRQNQLEDVSKTHHEEIEVYKKRERQYIATIGKFKNKILLKSEENKQLRDLLALHNIVVPPLNELINIHSNRSYNISSSTAQASVLPETTPTHNELSHLDQTVEPSPTKATPTKATPTSPDPPTSVTPPSPISVSPSNCSTSNVLSSSQTKRSLRLSRPKRRSIYHNTNEGISTEEKDRRENGIKNNSTKQSKKIDGTEMSDDVIVIDDVSLVGVVSSEEGVVTNIEADSQSVSSDDTIICENKRMKQINETIPLFNTRCYDDDDEEEELTCYHDNGEESIGLLNERKGEELNRSMSPSVLSQVPLSEEYPLSHEINNRSHDKSHDLDKNTESPDRSGGVFMSPVTSKKRKRKGVAVRRSSLQTTMTQHISTGYDALGNGGKSPNVIPPTPFIRVSPPLHSSSRNGWKTDLITSETPPPPSLSSPKRTDINNERVIAAKAGLPTYKCVVNLRKKSDREKLGAKSCAECDRWYRNNNDLYDSPTDHLQKTCRHRHLYLPPESDPTIWNMEFPDTAKVTETLKDNDSDYNED